MKNIFKMSSKIVSENMGNFSLTKDNDMKIIKIIDLFIKIANGEEVPKKIKYCGEEFQFTGYDSASKNYINELEDLFEVLDGSMLNDEVEILEDEKKIPKKLDKKDFLGNQTIEQIDADLDFIIDKINEILDYLESEKN